MRTKAQVRRLLKRAKYYRNDDKILTLAVWQESGFVLTPEQRAVFMTLPSMDSITRRRREMRSEYPESPAVMEKRYKAFKDKREEYSKAFNKKFNINLSWLRLKEK